MCLLLETIRINNGKPQNLEYHQARLNAAMKFHFTQYESFKLSEYISCPVELQKDIVKCRVLYDRSIQTITYDSYSRRLIQSLALVHNNNIEYNWKYADRSEFEEMSGNNWADDVLIVKNGLITDTSFSNIAFFDGKNWLTPKTPLLKGTRRESLLRTGKLYEADISPKDLPTFAEARIINAMIDIFDHPAIAVEAIK